MDRIGRKINGDEQVLDIPSQEASQKITPTSLSMRLRFIQVIDAPRGRLRSQQPEPAIINLTMTNIRTVLSVWMELDEMLSPQRDSIKHTVAAYCR